MRRRAEVELEYSRGLDKLVERFSGRGGRLGGSSREHQSFRWVLGPGSWDGQGGGRGGLTPTPGRSEPRSPPPHPQEGAVPAVALALLGCVVAADSAAEPGKHSSQRGAGRAPGPAPELHCRGCGAPGQEGKTPALGPGGGQTPGSSEGSPWMLKAQVSGTGRPWRPGGAGGSLEC